MNNRKVIVPERMQPIVDRAGYIPALSIAGFVFCAGQVGRDDDLNVVHDPEAQFVAAWQNLATVLLEAGCTFNDVVDLTTYHVAMREHMAAFRSVKDTLFPRATCPWTCVGVSELATPGLLVEIKCTARLPG